MGASPARVGVGVAAPEGTKVAVTCTTWFAATSIEEDQSSYPVSVMSTICVPSPTL
jgi:hypothetical protein